MVPDRIEWVRFGDQARHGVRITQISVATEERFIGCFSIPLTDAMVACSLGSAQGELRVRSCKERASGDFEARLLCDPTGRGPDATRIASRGRS